MARFLLGLASVALWVVLTGEAGAGVLVAVGTDYGEKPGESTDYGSQPIILRLDTADAAGAQPWFRSAVPEAAAPRLGPPVLVGVVEAAGGTAWTFGWTESGPIVFRSDDTGYCWTDVSDALPAGTRSHRARAMVFSNDVDGWMLTTDTMGVGPYLWRTRTAGREWEGVSSLSLSIGDTFHFRKAGPEIQLLRSSGDETTLSDLSNLSPKTADGVPLKGVRANAIGGYGSELWIAGDRDRNDTDKIVALYAHGPDGSWSRRGGEALPDGQLRSIAFASSTAGVACGSTIVGDVTYPLCVSTTDGGASWAQSTFPPDLAGMVVTDVVMDSPAESYAIAQRLGDPGMAILAAAERSRTWHRMDTDLDSSSHLRAMARLDVGAAR